MASDTCGDETTRDDTSADALRAGSEATPKEEPYLEPEYLDKPILDLYRSGVDNWILEEPDSGAAWIYADKDDFIDVEVQR